MTALSSKVVSKNKRKMAQISVDAVLSVADLARKDVNFDLIKLQEKTGGYGFDINGSQFPLNRIFYNNF